ncbi:MAG: sulfotransferase family 2 domain-containing protein, partial [Akkermansiaceae bacterium]|nr:sulfotransferase family 2 domain-containing protein [Akkermansiaceae bacterium]
MEQVLRTRTAKNPVFGHTTAVDYQMMFPDKWARYYSFGFARNPWDRLVSSFFYLQRSHRDSFFVRNFVLPHHDDLSAFVVSVIREHPSSIFMVEHL